MPEKSQPQATGELNFEVINPEGRPILPVSGAIGATNGQGLVIAHLFAEFPDVPTNGSVKFTVPAGEILDHNMPIRGGVHVREILATLMLSPEAAEALGDFFKSQAQKALESRFKK